MKMQTTKKESLIKNQDKTDLKIKIANQKIAMLDRDIAKIEREIRIIENLEKEQNKND